MATTLLDDYYLLTYGASGLNILKHYWPLNEANGATTAIDYAGTQNGTNTNCTAGQVGMVSDGSTCYNNASTTAGIDLGTTPLPVGASNAFSFECWITRSINGTFPYLLSSSSSIDSGGATIWLDGSNNMMFNGNSATFVPVLSTAYKISFCSDGKFYVNGALVRNNGGNWYSAGTPTHAYLGRPNALGSSGPAWGGKMQKMAWYNASLTPAQVLANYNADTQGPPSPPSSGPGKTLSLSIIQIGI